MHKTCKNCENIVKRSGRKFCSGECYHSWVEKSHRVIKFCVCGKQIQSRSNFETKTRRFCSHKCFRENYKHSEETIRKIGENRKGKYGHSEKQRDEVRQRMLGNKYALGNKLSDKHRQTIRQAHIGDKSHFYKDGRCDDPKYISWISNRHGVRKRRAEGNHTHQEWEDLKKKYNYTCLGCGKKEPEIKLTEDHIIPLSKGGSDSIENIQPLCKPCNCKKHNKLPIKN